MVAYSFNKLFVPQVEARTKRQTIRAPRKRHARPGEPIQVYTAMRTRSCRKLLDPDPTCQAVEEVVIEVGADWIDAIILNGRPLDDDEIEALARVDGFSPDHLTPAQFIGTKYKRHEWKPGTSARTLMGMWWDWAHGQSTFHGVLIRW